MFGDVRTKTPPFQPGDRIRLDAMIGDPDPIPPGALGTVESCIRFASDWQVEVRWDSGRTLSLVVPPDRASRVSAD